MVIFYYNYIETHNAPDQNREKIMSSNLNKLKIKDIRDFGIATVEYNGFEILATEYDGEIVLSAIVSYEEDSDAHVSVLEVCGDTMKEAKAYLVEEIAELAHTAEEIAALAIEKQFTGQYDKLVSTLEQTEPASIKPVTEPKKTNARGVSARELIAEKATELLGMTGITFEQRGKYNGWHIMATDVDGKSFEQRLDVFKKKLVTMGAL